jgi:translation initiation factor 5A
MPTTMEAAAGRLRPRIRGSSSAVSDVPGTSGPRQDVVKYILRGLIAAQASFMKEQAEVRQLRPGRYVIIDDEPCKITSISTSKPGKHGAAKARIEGVGIFTNSKRTLQAPVTEKVFVPMIDKRQAQVVAIMGDHVQLMDMGTYETFDMEIPSEFKEQLEAGKEVSYLEAMGKRMITRA